MPPSLMNLKCLILAYYANLLKSMISRNRTSDALVQHAPCASTYAYGYIGDKHGLAPFCSKDRSLCVPFRF